MPDHAATDQPARRPPLGIMLALAVITILLLLWNWLQPLPPANQAYIQQQQEALQTFAEHPDTVTLEHGAMIRHLKTGDGRQPTTHSMITVHYEGRLSDGTIFDSSRERGLPATFPLSGVIPGWRQALPQMAEGGSAEIMLSAELAYGARPQRQIPAYSALHFTIELLKVE